MATGDPPLYGVIMAGGTGTRFWPASRRYLPKQFLAFGQSDQTLIRATFDRLAPICGAERILVVANEDYRDLVRRELPELREEHFLGEPRGRNTAPCVGLAAHSIAAENPDAAMLVCPADHVIGPDEEFQRSIRFAVELLDRATGKDPATVTLGIPPTFPATGYGYIERGESLVSRDGLEGFRVAQFKEKPDLPTAERYVKSGKFFWNAGIFLWRAGGALELIQRYLPDLAAGLDPIAESVGDAARLKTVLAERFGDLPSISIDYGVLERSKNVATAVATFDWDDVGSWGAVAKYLRDSGEGNRTRGEHVAIDTSDCVVVSGKRLVATVGVRNLVIVETEDSILVCDRDRVEDVKALVDELKSKGRDDLL